MAWASWALQDFTDSRILHFQTHASLILNGWRLKLAGGSPPWPSPTSTRTTKASTRCAWSPKEAPQSIVPLSLSQVRPPGWTPPCVHVSVYPVTNHWWGSLVLTLWLGVDGPPPVPNAPGAPMDIKIHDANRDYVIVSWKPPNTTTEGPILGYFVDK